ncbi:MAG: sugar phosphate isomerase/epimerase family protein, partial [Gemmatimonadaceae bacterium]
MLRRGFVLEGFGLAAMAAAWRNASSLPHAPRIRFGYAAITWDGADRRAIDDISSLGFTGIQLRGSAVTAWGDRPAELKALLAARGLTLVALSSGTVALDPAAAPS